MGPTGQDAAKRVAEVADFYAAAKQTLFGLDVFNERKGSAVKYLTPIRTQLASACVPHFALGLSWLPPSGWFASLLASVGGCVQGVGGCVQGVPCLLLITMHRAHMPGVPCCDHPHQGLLQL